MAYIKFKTLTRVETTKKIVGDIYKMTVHGINMQLIGYEFYIVESILDDGRHTAKKLIKKEDRFNISTSKPVFMLNTITEEGAKVWRVK